MQLRLPDQDRAQDRAASALAVAGLEETPQTSFVCVGDIIDVDQQDGFLRSVSWPLAAVQKTVLLAAAPAAAELWPCRGHGTQVVDGRLIATLCGIVQRVDKLVSVRPVKSRF